MTKHTTQNRSSRISRPRCRLAGGFHLKPLLALLALLLVLVGTYKASAATYYSVGSSVWSDVNNWGTGTGGQGAPQGPPGTLDTANTRPGTVTVDADTACAAITVGSGSSATLQRLTFNGAWTLTVSGTVNIGSASSSTRPGYLLFTSGATVSAGSVQLNRELSGSTKSWLDMTAGGKLVTGSLAVGGGNADPLNAVWLPGTTTGTVELNANNTLPLTHFTTFNNLTISGGFTTTLAVGTPIAIGGDLKFASASDKMNLGTTTTSQANTLWINGVQQPAGVWGPPGSGAAHESAAFSTATSLSGRINVVGGSSCTSPPAPTGLTATTPGLGQVHLAWTAPGGTITGYKIYRSTSPGTETLYASPIGAGTTYDDNGVTPGLHYYYKVMAVDASCDGSLSDEAGAIPSGSYWSGANGNWSDPNTWSISSSGAPTGYGPPGASDVAYLRGFKTVTVDGSAACQKLEYSYGSSWGAINFSGTTPTLTVAGRLDVGGTSGSTRVGVLTFTSDTTVTAGQCWLNPHHYLDPGFGIDYSKIDMTAGGKLVTGSLGVGGTDIPENAIWIPGAGTVVLNANNTLPATHFTNFNNLTITNGTTRLSTDITITNLVIATSAVMNLGTNANSTADTLWIGGVQKPAGVWGSLTSGADHVSAAFAGTSGRITVATGTACTPPPAPTGSASQTFCDGATVANLAATGTGIRWYATASGGSPLPTDTALVNGTHYYASQVADCESTSRLDVTATVTVTAAPTGSASQTFNASTNPTVANLVATGASIQWYAAASGGSPLSAGTALVDGTHYYASQTVSGCESTSRLDVTATVTATPPVVTLGIGFSGSDVQLTWSQGLLLEATNVTGPWTTNSAATPPSYTVPPTGAGKFYRVQVQ